MRELSGNNRAIAANGRAIALRLDALSGPVTGVAATLHVAAGQHVCTGQLPQTYKHGVFALRCVSKLGLTGFTFCDRFEHDSFCGLQSGPSGAVILQSIGV